MVLQGTDNQTTYSNQMNVNQINIQIIKIMFQEAPLVERSVTEVFNTLKASGQATNPAGDSLSTQNDSSSLLEVNIISVVVLLVNERYKFKKRWQHTKVVNSFGLCLRGTLCRLAKTGFESSVQKHTSFPKG